jgi:Ca2+-transporting ATPase
LTDWYRITTDDAFAQTTSSRQGLDPEEAARRLAERGPNQLAETDAKSPWRILLEQFTSILIIILILAAAVSLFLGDFEDAVAIFAVLVLNAVLGFRQEHKAEKTMQAL